MKTCTKCLQDKDISCFSTNGNKGYRSHCKQCRCDSAKEYREQNQDKLRMKDRQYYLAHKQDLLQKSKAYAARHKDEICENKKAYYRQNKQEIAQYHANRKEQRNAQRKVKRKIDPSFRITESLKARIHTVLCQEKQERSSKLIGCSKEELTDWIQFQFDDSMTWENYASHWHIDHVVPIAAFDATNKIHQRWCFHWTNLRPLAVQTNLEKSAKILVHDILSHSQIVSSYVPLNPRYQTIPEKEWWSRLSLEYGNKPEDDFVKWMTNEMGNPQRSS